VTRRAPQGPRAARSAGRLSAAAVALLVLTGCGNAVVRSGAAAVVGDTRITTDQLAQDVETGLADPGAAQLAEDRPAYQRDVLSRIINARVVDEAARRRGVTVTEGQVDEQYAAIEQSVGGAEQLQTQAAAAGLGLPQVRDLARTRAQAALLGEKLTEGVVVPPAQLQQAYQQGIDQYDQVRTAQIQLAGIGAARRLLPDARVLNDTGFAQLASTRSLDETTKAQGGDLGFLPQSAFAQGGLEAYGRKAFAAQPGDTFAVSSERGGHVVRVLERRTVTLEQATPELRRTVLAEQSGQALEAELRSVAEDMGVSINPRFGRWDPAQLVVTERGATGDRQVSTPGAGSAAEPAPVDGGTAEQ